ncbi:FecR domain-containing protein [Danxiaibacter flavus]|uniref:FecR domain-containing protein n=1 Tax=Danxiaibacter flavus TaxID=3049108 RepID=A0ABV3ZMM8_9BACT|nr:FecR domain-containing protein [Chitinophagaceae bacterium DXS]
MDNLNSDEYIQSLLNKYAHNECSEDELALLHNWLDAKAAGGDDYKFIDEEDKKKVRDEIFSNTIPATDVPVKRIKWWRYLSVAASLLCVVAGIYYFSSVNKKMIALNTSAGHVSKEILPDGSTIWLNENTQVIYASNFENNRSLEIKEGEVFFEVKKDAAHPFTVITNDVHTVVKGTSFSVKKMIAGDVKVSVVTGKVLVSKQADTLGFILPGQRLRYASANNKVRIDSSLSLEANGWINGEILLQNVSVNEVADWLQNHFSVNVENRKEGYAGEYHLQVDKNITIEKVIDILNLLGAKNNVRFILQNNTVIIQ